MNKLVEAILAAYADESEHHTNTVYRVFLGHTLWVPVQPESVTESGEYQPLYQTAAEAHFIPIFSSEETFKAWAGEVVNEFTTVQVRGLDVIRGAGERVFLCLDVGTEHYKEFAPDEIAKLKGIVFKFDTQRQLQQ